MHDVYYFSVCGRVQGVSFRASARNAANDFGIHGWIRNRADGCVEGVACGSANALNAFHEWLRQGPSRAQVVHVTFEPTTQAAPDKGFTIA